MTFYVEDESAALPDLPSLGFILDENPGCYQSLHFWEQQTEEIGNVVSHVTACAKAYHKAGMEFTTASINFTSGLQKAANVLSKDAKLRNPLLKFSDMLQRVDCYHDMFLNQTETLMCGQLENLAKEFDKVKEMKQQVRKASNEMHISWEKFSSCQNISNLQEPSILDKLAYNMLSTRQRYQQLLSSYINSLREINTVKKVSFVKTLVEHILAKFFFVNFSYQILKDSENYTNELFDDLLNRVVHSEISCENDARLKKVVGEKIDELLEKDKAAFHAPPTILGSSTLAHSVTTVNTQAGKFFNRINDFLGSSGLRESTRKSQKGSQPSSPDDKQPSLDHWEVLEESGKTATEPKTPDDSSPLVITEDKTDENVENKGVQPAANQLSSEVKTEISSEKEKGVNDHDSSSWGAFKSAEKVQEDVSSSTTSATDTKSEETLEPEILEIPNVSKWSNYHRDYLRIKQKAFPKNKWPLLYFIVDESSGRLMAQGKDQRAPVEYENLLLSSVKTCDVLEADRNFCFQLTSPKSEHVFQALTENKMHQWIAAIQAATTEALKKSKEKLQSLTTSYSYGSNVKSEEQKKFVSNAPERIRKVEGNKRCVDCDHPRPDWASINIGIVMCIECSGVHRSLGVHISKVRSLTLDKWEEKVVQFMESHGNTKANEIYEANLGDYKKPSRDSTKEERSRFIRLKYTDRTFIREDVDDDVDPEVELTCLKEHEHDEENLLDESGEHVSPRLLQLDHGLRSSSPLCLVDGCEECLTGGHITSEPQNFASSQLKVDDNDDA